MSGESKTSPRRIAAAERKNRALQLRIAGATYEQIARTKLTDDPSDPRTLYKDRKRAWEAVMSALAEQAADTTGKGAELKALELARLESMQVQLWPSTRERKPVLCPGCGETVAREVSVEAVDRILKIMAQRSRYLGLDAQKGENDGVDAGESLIASLMAAIEEGVPPDDGSAFLTGGDTGADGDEDP